MDTEPCLESVTTQLVKVVTNYPLGNWASFLRSGLGLSPSVPTYFTLPPDLEGTMRDCPGLQFAKLLTSSWFPVHQSPAKQN